MDSTIALIIVIAIFTLTLLAGLHISSVLILTGAIGIYLIVGIAPVINLIQIDTFSTVASYTLTTIPLFVLMSQFIVHADIVKYLYSLIFIISRGKSSILGVFTVILGGFLGAVSGSASAMSAALGQFAVPELKKHGYNQTFAASIAAAAGSLATIIPPSIGLIIYGAITQTSISSLFIGILIPGIITLAVISIIVVIIFKKESKNIGEIQSNHNTTRYSTKNYVVSAITGILIILSIFGGIYLGIFTPTEAGGVGAFITLIAAFILKKVNMKFLINSFRETLKITTMVMMIMVGATIFTRFVTLSQIPQKLIESLGPLTESPILIILILLAVFFVAFMFLEGAAAIVMLVPITLPLVETVGFSALEFGILISVVGTAGLMTPPVGISTYAVSGVTGIPSNKIFNYTLLYAIVISVVVSAILLLFPQLITWLPSSMN
ncbi:TRAP transporter large permease [Bacillus sp. FJAT-45350]|uniref:TRAP transporter large permease n=1 Tax=Bacillus sp. FJAT-45350 TaxID=2011014 RepID=UPI000BB77FD7|nr:TRAP transporter large permease subunit [Bacillus sp. FJAT-45350]